MTLYSGIFRRVVIGVDPAVTRSDRSAETGIVVAALGEGQRFYVLEDSSGAYAVAQWSERVRHLYDLYGAHTVVAEINQGGDLVEHTLKGSGPGIHFKGVRAMRCKAARAQPIIMLYERGLVFHVRPFPEMEAQMCALDGTTGARDRVDALVWALTDLMGNGDETASGWRRPGAPYAWAP